MPSTPTRRRRPKRHTPRWSFDEDKRRALVPALNYPQQLPVVEAKDEIVAALREHQVVVVAGETGSGKTTQLPKMCLEIGRGLGGMIAHTQPRRIAARAVAERLAEELDVELGATVGYQVRFSDHSTRDTLIKVMTDGILLSAMQADRDLRQFDTIIVDEAHERSLNIDFILGYLKQLLPRRPDLKVIITSATIDPEKFAEHFATQGVPAPIIEVSGRTYPVEVRYRPLVREIPGKGADGTPTTVDVDQVTGIVDAIEELATEPDTGGPHDVLVFCSGEREIRDAADALAGLKLPDTEIVPLYARLSAAEQHRVFTPHQGRRIVIATNVAETSLTVPGIRYVVDTGTARISRYSQRTKVQRLPIEPISQASALQRTGRCGRVAEGVCIRLYSQEDFEARPEFTDPEIQRTGLASVILAMTSLGLGDITRFPFVDAPDRRQITDGLRLLHELDAIDSGATDRRRRLTRTGRSIAALPVDPRMARMLVAAAETGALREVLVIVAALSIQDPRERPVDKRAQADQLHARFKREDSDFLGYLALWDYLREQQKALSGSAFRRMCRDEYLHYLRVREWQELHAQLRQVCRDLGLRPSDNPAAPDTIHQAILTGLLSQVGLRDRDTRDYLGARNARFAIQPGSALFRSQPDWVMAAEMVETSRLWARDNARIDPAWVEAAAQHLVKRSYSDPHWSRKRAAAMAAERVTLYGIPLVAGRQANFAAVDPEYARELFIRHALVEGDWDTHHRFFHDNRKLVQRLSELEARARRRDLVVGDDVLYEFYDERLPADIVSGAHFDSWWKKHSKAHPRLLTFTEDLLLSDDAAAVDVADYPKTWHQGDLSLPLTYQFDPGADADGVTVHVPVDQLNRLQDNGFDWLVPGLREELVTALIRSLPKATRRSFVPAPDHARAALVVMGTDPSRPITEVLGEVLRQRTGTGVDPGEWDWSRVPDHLRMTFRVEGARGRTLAEGKDLAVLQRDLAGDVQRTVSKAAGSLERSGLRAWSFGTLPETFEGNRVKGFPALVDSGDTVDLKVLPTASERDHATRAGLRKLLLLNTTVPWKQILGLLDTRRKLALSSHPYASQQALYDDILAAAIDAIVADGLPGGSVRTEADFDQALRLVRQQVVPRVIEIVDRVGPVLEHARELQLRLDAMTAPSVAALRAEVQKGKDALVHPGFVSETGAERLVALDRYVRAGTERLTKAPENLARDAQRQAEVDTVEAERQALLAKTAPTRHTDPDVVALRWMIEELKVSLFAQKLGTAGPVSPKRIYQAMDAVEDETEARAAR
ncbi:ATP-dependent RNA helicase HrpA [Calidifontibacter sp. DB0510]|uniref:ATP-dependent RNA helicase HrpA n=1 Tax=Metallococcus carri TaxID=1656884 RepID=A0A967EA99_9MICO|nr:ATP-dependent RNA helicase HrpA [Metallococcus carri]NHN56055.1 ATP-dependent RNA helicase HrpA [Metallococcus carri]NOP37488.1 ATP-dependent RNA helicase HrpA [Calidifontibacter sp. DB2511S]